ncbi:MAG: hypothetical protein ACRDTC_00055 [Pseudonocardiaceae bacterium]
MSQTGGRSCPACQITALSRYNPDPLCAPCTRASRKAEFVEAALLREYRRNHRIPMTELRQFIDLLSDHYGVTYPLAHHQPFISGRQLVYKAQEGSGLAPEFCLVAAVSGQYVLTARSGQGSRPARNNQVP